MQQTAVKEILSSSFSPITATQRFQSLTEGTAAEILKHIDIIHAILYKAGIPSRPYTVKSAEALLVLSEEKKLEIVSNLRQWTEIILSSSPSPELDFLEEARMVEKALKQFSFKLKDHVWDSTAEEQIVEVYTTQGVQLYRSLGFFRTCGYSLLDLCVNEWFILWERPQKVLQEMNALLSNLLSGNKKDSAVNIAPHLVMETFDDGCTQPFLPRAIFVTFKNIYPLFTANDQICGFVLTSTAKVVSEGEESLKINFI